MTSSFPLQAKILVLLGTLVLAGSAASLMLLNAHKKHRATPAHTAPQTKSFTTGPVHKTATPSQSTPAQSTPTHTTATPVQAAPAHAAAPAHSTSVRPAKAHAATARATTARAASQPAVDGSLPAPLRNALRRNALVVAVVGTRGDPADAQVLAEARQGAASAHAKLVVLDIRRNDIAAATAAWMNNVVEPATLIVRRPGTIAVELDGYADSEMVAQAVVNSRR